MEYGMKGGELEIETPMTLREHIGNETV